MPKKTRCYQVLTKIRGSEDEYQLKTFKSKKVADAFKRKHHSKYEIISKKGIENLAYT